MYLLFSGADEYPAGGAEDFVGMFTSIQAAKAAFAAQPQDWAHIAVLERTGLSIVCSYGTTWEATQEGRAAWHDCTDA